MRSYNSTDGQSVLDVCLSVYGSLDYLLKFVTDNNIESIDYEPKTGEVYFYDEKLVVNNNAIQVRSSARYSTLYKDGSVSDFNIDFNNDF